MKTPFVKYCVIVSVYNFVLSGSERLILCFVKNERIL